MLSNPSAWRTLAFASYANVRDELERLEAITDAQSKRQQPPDTSAQAINESIIQNVRRALSEALTAMLPDERGARRRRRGVPWRKLPDDKPDDEPRLKRPPRWLGFKLFYAGTRIEQATGATHRARASLYLLCPDSELNAQIEGLQELLGDLPESSTLRGSLTTALGQLKREPLAPGTRASLREIYEQAIGVSDGLQREARVLRNTLMTASAGIFVVVLALGVAHAINRDIVELCTKVNTSTYCPIGGSLHPFDVFAVELAGMLGGLLSVVIPLANGERIKTPYRVFNQQLMLKTLAGAATALAGVILVEAELIPALSVKSSAAILGYAIFFGFSQQVITGAIDRRADALAKQTPSAKQV